MLVLVTGATGLLGNNVARNLLADGQRVRVLVRDQADGRALAGLDLEIARGDVRDWASVAAAVKGVDWVIHSAGYVRVGWSGLALAREINVEGTRHVAAATHAEKAKLIHVSSIDALGTGSAQEAVTEDSPLVGGVLCPYVVTKRESERVVLELVAAGLDARIVNPGYLIGPYDWKPSSGRMLLAVAKGRGRFAPLGANHFCDVRDVAGSIRTVMDRGVAGRRYILGGERLSYFNAWRIFADVTGGARPRFPAGPLIRMAAGYCGDLWGKVTGKEPDVNSAVTRISGMKRNFSSARASAELEYHPRPLREAAAAAWEWFQANGYA